MANDVFILGGKRTPMGEYVGALKDVSAIDLGAVAARGALEATGVTGEDIDHTVIGNALQTSGDAIYGARHVALKAGGPGADCRASSKRGANIRMSHDLHELEGGFYGNIIGGN